MFWMCEHTLRLPESYQYEYASQRLENESMYDKKGAGEKSQCTQKQIVGRMPYLFILH